MKKQFFLLAILFLMGSPMIHAQIVKVRPSHPSSGAKPPRPQPDYFWVEGDWHWSVKQGRYAWVPAHWAKPIPGFMWVEGHWESGPWGHKWLPGRWIKEVGSNATNHKKKK